MSDEPTGDWFETALEAIEAELDTIERACKAAAADRRARCPACGTARRPGDPIVCGVCGGAVLDDGWAP